MPEGILAKKEENIDLFRVIETLKKGLKINDYGAIITFTGIVRNMAADKTPVDRLEYEVYEDAAKASLQGMAKALVMIEGVKDAAICHKYGTFKPGEEVLYVAIATDHSAIAFDTLKLAVNRIKHELPIWKKEHSSDGSYWVDVD